MGISWFKGGLLMLGRGLLEEWHYFNCRKKILSRMHSSVCCQTENDTNKGVSKEGAWAQQWMLYAEELMFTLQEISSCWIWRDNPDSNEFSFLVLSPENKYINKDLSGHSQRMLTFWQKMFDRFSLFTFELIFIFYFIISQIKQCF